ncbi:MaoC family dehydratase N-terminal domain-containing protein [Dactylosporangium sucinum]|uniref:FAS1-like dehydratase domain-containing protein n=1 Tax=Dactylosporangium sucinum TaxID=1424081 RepID=A0A917X0B1_9ACTN|nr:MaoC family dehydratase N-terminal domain-containing protein [Dactylosporangium sucinum]GGM46038.1 hypothetical protein GCM10007977_054740 [Dactylosporangium sucinum]
MSLLTDELRALIGSTKTYTAPEPLGAAAGRYFAFAIGDDNPLYVDAEYARAHGLAGVTAPPTLICETNQYANVAMDAEGYAGHTWGLELPNTRKVRGGNSYEFHRRIRPEDVVTATWEIADMTEKKTGGGADMLIVTSRATYRNQDGEPLATNEETIIFVSLGEPA